MTTSWRFASLLRRVIGPPGYFYRRARHLLYWLVIYLLFGVPAVLLFGVVVGKYFSILF